MNQTTIGQEMNLHKGGLKNEQKCYRRVPFLCLGESSLGWRIQNDAHTLADPDKADWDRGAFSA